MRGFEPLRTDPESAVLPLDDIPSGEKSLAGLGGFEPPDAGTKTRCLTAWLQPKNYNGGEGGIRTLGRLLTYIRLAGARLQPTRPPLHTACAAKHILKYSLCHSLEKGNLKIQYRLDSCLRRNDKNWRRMRDSNPHGQNPAVFKTAALPIRTNPPQMKNQM